MFKGEDGRLDLIAKLIIGGILIVLALIARVVFDLPPNFAPIAAIAIFAGALMPRMIWAVALPLGAIIISDLFIGLHSTILFTWGSFALIAMLSYRFVQADKPLAIGGMSVAGSVLFFVISNFGVWLMGTLYPMTLSGLATSYYMAIPFFRNTLMGDLVFTVALFGAYWLAVKYILPLFSLSKSHELGEESVETS